MLLLFYIYAALAKRKLKNQLVRACQWRNRGSRLFVLHCVLFLLSHSRSVLKQLYDLFIIHPLYTLCMIILNNTYIITLWKMGPSIVRRGSIDVGGGWMWRGGDGCGDVGAEIRWQTVTAAPESLSPILSQSPCIMIHTLSEIQLPHHSPVCSRFCGSVCLS